MLFYKKMERKQEPETNSNAYLIAHISLYHNRTQTTPLRPGYPRKFSSDPPKPVFRELGGKGKLPERNALLIAYTSLPYDELWVPPIYDNYFHLKTMIDFILKFKKLGY